MISGRATQTWIVSCCRWSVCRLPSTVCRKIGGEAYTKLVADWVVETVEWCEVKHEIGGKRGLDQTFLNLGDLFLSRLRVCKHR